MTPIQIVAIISAVGEILRIVTAARAEAKRTAEWTPEQEAAFQEALAAAKASPAWQIS